MDTAHKRRNTGKGRGPVSRRSPDETTRRERRRLIQLAVSGGLFLLVYFGRGILPQQGEALRTALNADGNLGGAVTAFMESLSGDGTAEQAVETFWETLQGAPTEQETDPPVVLTLPPYRERSMIVRTVTPSEQLEEADGTGLANGEPSPVEEQPDAGGENGAGTDVAPVPTDEPVATAVAQGYTEDGQALPANVSLQYYPLGLEETTSPVEGKVTSSFGYRDHPINGEYGFHMALDIGAAHGSEIKAFAAGTVEKVGENSTAGLYVWIDHGNSVKTFYAHCSKLLVKAGERVACGETIALVGETGDATGPHLHLVLEKDGIRLDPALYLS